LPDIVSRAVNGAKEESSASASPNQGSRSAAAALVAFSAAAWRVLSWSLVRDLRTLSGIRADAWEGGEGGREGGREEGNGCEEKVDGGRWGGCGRECGIDLCPGVILG